ncbi:MAG: LamG domain-containing protein [Nitrososphaeraceae archaeon]
MNREISTTIIASSFVVFLFYFSLTIEEGNYNNSFFNNIAIFAQDDNAPVVKNSKIIEFSGINYADVVNSRDINLNSFTVSVWFNTAMNVTSGNNAILLNKGGFGSDRPGFNLNYGIWLNNREKVTGGFETPTGDDYSLTSQGSYDDSTWHNAILTFDGEQHLLKLYMDGLEVATNSTNIGITPDTTGKQPIRLGANSLAEKGKINGNYTGQLDDIQIWNYAFTKEQAANLFDTESKIAR